MHSEQHVGAKSGIQPHTGAPDLRHLSGVDLVLSAAVGCGERADHHCTAARGASPRQPARSPRAPLRRHASLLCALWLLCALCVRPAGLATPVKGYLVGGEVPAIAGARVGPGLQPPNHDSGCLAAAARGVVTPQASAARPSGPAVSTTVGPGSAWVNLYCQSSPTQPPTLPLDRHLALSRQGCPGLTCRKVSGRTCVLEGLLLGPNWEPGHLVLEPCCDLPLLRQMLPHLRY